MQNPQADKPSFTLLHTEWSSGWGGQEIRILAESKAFRARGVRVLIAAQPDGRLIKQAKDEGFSVFPIHMHKGLNIAAIMQFMKLIRQETIDIVHCHSSVDHRLASIAARLTGTPIVRSRHLSTPIKRSPISKALYTKLADRVITSGQFIKDVMIKDNGMPAEHIVSIPAGIDIHQFSLDRDLPDIRAELGWSANNFVVGIVGVLRSWKGHDDLLQAIHQLRDKIPGIKLLIVGDGPVRHVLEEQIQHLGLQEIVHMTGHQKDPAPYIKAMDVTVLPSYANEATSQVLPQAMAMMRPVISSTLEGLQEVVIHEETGLNFPARNINALAETIVRIYENPDIAHRFAVAGYEHVMQHFTFDGMIEQTLKVYLDLLPAA